MTTPSDEDLLATFTRRLEQRKSAPAKTEQNAYHLAAAVLHVFDPTTLLPYWNDNTNPRSALQALIDDSAPAVGWRSERLRTLKVEARVAALERLGTRQSMREALAANPGRRRTPLQELFEQWVNEVPIVPEELGYAQLSELKHLYEWRLERFGGLPDPDRAEDARLRRGAVAVFEHLVDNLFVGRQRELQMLRDHVGTVPPSRWEKFKSFLPSRSPALVVHGRGGAGKTALVGRFLLEHVNADNGWFPFAYLPFDSATLDVHEPFTILVAAWSQLSAQLGSMERANARGAKVERAVVDFRDAMGRYRDDRGVLRQRGTALAGQAQRLSGISSVERSLYDSFASLLRGISSAAGQQQGATEVPVVLVFDTFEEVIYRTREELDGLWRMLTVIRRGFPGLRIVIASRAKPREFTIDSKPPIELEVGTLLNDDALTLLDGLGIDDQAAARAIVRQVGGHPLSLRLAARVASEERVGGDGISGLRTKRYWLLGVADELIQGQLYRRILDHIHDPDVRALAHPGMVMRRVTPEVIKRVLAPVCGLRGVTTERASQLFEALGAETALVGIEQDGALKYREDVRQPVLELLARDKPDEVRAIHAAAVEYYVANGIDTPIDRAEEIYHRLMLQEGRETVLARWVDGVERFLADAIPEIPATQRIWIAHQMSLELPPEVYKAAELADWERLYGRKALDAIRFSGPKDSLKLLAERTERTPESPLFAIEARCLLAVDRAPEAFELIDRAIRGYPAFGNVGRLAELVWLQANTSLVLGRGAQAMTLLRQLVEMSPSLASPLTRVQALATLVELEAASGSPHVATTRETLSQTLLALDIAEIDAERSVIRVALVRLGRDYPITIARLSTYIISPWSLLMQQQKLDVRSALGEVVAPLEAAGRAEIASLARSAATMDLDGAQHMALVVVERLADEDPDSRLADVILRLLDADHPTLRGASLAGLDSYREQWELHAAPEVRA